MEKLLSVHRNVSLMSLRSWAAAFITLERNMFKLLMENVFLKDGVRLHANPT